MSPAAVVHALLRRWYVLVVALLLTAAGAYHQLRPAPLYLSSAVVVVRPPVTGNQPNQLANLQPAVAAVSYAIVEQLQSPAGDTELRAAGVQGTYQLIPRNSGTNATPHYLIPSLQVQTQLGDPTVADDSVQRIIQVYAAHLQALQDTQGIPKASRMTPDVVVAPSAAEVHGTRSRSLAAVALLGSVGGVLAALWTDRFALGRRRRRDAGGLGATALPV
ncbi:hypothetical protein [Streptacidiphilus sp. EB129]|uniref:hypothetical protein n=1 Tax=Streptacidiphilus sp. EB129 TaxID=3156262 RepID=UPI00351249FA